MHTTDTKSQFLQLRAKGWSLARIAAHLNVSPRTLVDWNRQSRDELRTLRALEIEALQEKILATHEAELTRLSQQLQRIEDEAAQRKLQFVDTENLFRLSSLLRSEIRKIRLDPDLNFPGPLDVGAPSLPK
jgi:Homeodomain-like domain